MLADNDRMMQAERECVECIKKLEGMVSAVAMARQIVGLRDDRIKKSLSVLVSEYIRKGGSALAAEWNARADERFTQMASDILDQTAEAASVLLKWDIERLKFENAQALRNDERAKLKLL
jgi:type I site-specific restriction endonuclease